VGTWSRQLARRVRYGVGDGGHGMEIAGKVAVVTGGGSGIGRATVLALVEGGAKVVVADLHGDAGRQTLALARRAGGSAMFQHCDVTRPGDLGAAFEAALLMYDRLDVVVNNAGVSGEDLFADAPGDWARIIEIDLTAVIDATRLAVRMMRQTGNGGAIVNTASLSGLGPMPSAPVYAAAKAGVVNFTRSLAYLADEAGIRVNAICPELVDTPMARALADDTLAELRREGGILRPEEVADGVLELIRDDTRTGAIMKVTVQGGREYATF
jgi:15-hydroxyprostaglandin dehydrogenase (NAD)